MIDFSSIVWIASRDYAIKYFGVLGQLVGVPSVALLIGLLVYLLSTKLDRKTSIVAKSLHVASICHAVGFVGTASVNLIAMFMSGSSTAGLSLLVLPTASLLAGLSLLVLGGALSAASALIKSFTGRATTFQRTPWAWLYLFLMVYLSSIPIRIALNTFSQNALQSKASSPESSEETLSRVFQKHRSNHRVIVDLANNPNCPVEILEELVANGPINQKYEAARHPRLSQETIKGLVADPSPYIRGAVAENPSLSIEDQQILSENSNPWIRSAVARNVSAYPQVLETLSQDVEESVRSVVARNNNTPLKILKKLAQENNRTVRPTARHTLALKERRRTLNGEE